MLYSVCWGVVTFSNTSIEIGELILKAVAHIGLLHRSTEKLLKEYFFYKVYPVLVGFIIFEFV